MHLVRTALIAAGLSALAAAPAHAQTFAFGAPTVLPGVGFYGASEVVMGDSGEAAVLMVGQVDSGPAPLSVAWVTPAGEYVAPVELGKVFNSAMHAEFDGGGTLHVIWQDENFHVSHARKPPGVPFLPADDLGSGSFSAADVNASGAVAVGGSMGSLKRAEPGQPPQDIALPSATAWISDLVLTDAGELIAARTWNDVDKQQPAYVEAITVAPGTSTAQVQRIEASATEKCFPSVAAAPSGRAVIGWHEPTSNCQYGVSYAALRPAGGAFGPAAVIPGPGGGDPPRFAVEADGRAVVAYHSSIPDGITPRTIVLTAGPAEAGWTTAAAVGGYLDGLGTGAAGTMIAFNGAYNGGRGPTTARVAGDGKLVETQDVAADCELQTKSFSVARDGRAAVLGWRLSTQEYRVFRQAPGAAAPAACAPPPLVAPGPMEPVSKSPAAKSAPTLTLSARRASRRTVTVTVRRSTPGPVTVRASLLVRGRPTVRRTASAQAPLKLTLRVPSATWRALLRRGGQVKVVATTPEGGQLVLRRTLARRRG